MNAEIEQLRAEIAALREATKLMFVLTTNVLAAAPNCATALVALMANVDEASKHLPGPVFADLSLSTLLALSAQAMKMSPTDPAVRAVFEQLRLGARH